MLIAFHEFLRSATCSEADREILSEAMNIVKVHMFFENLTRLAKEQRDDGQLRALIDAIQREANL